MLVCLSTGLRCSLKWSLSRRLVSPLLVTTIALYHVNNVFRVTVNVMMNRSCFARRIKCIASEPVCYIFARQAVVSSSKRATGLVTLVRVTEFGAN